MLYKYVFIFLLPLFLAIDLHAYSEDEIKSMYIDRFTMFFQWPKNSEDYEICIYNDPDFSKFIETNHKHKSHTHQLFIKYISAQDIEEQIDTCNIFYIRNKSFKPYAPLFKGKNILIVSDLSDDIYQDAMVSFLFNDNKIKFAINHKNLLNAGLNVHYKMLKYATIVDRVEE